MSAIGASGWLKQAAPVRWVTWVSWPRQATTQHTARSTELDEMRGPIVFMVISHPLDGWGRTPSQKIIERR
jgi:hypothetical protein